MADEMALAAQQWVNATYTSVSGYNPCTEDGKTGWQTMYALTRALQHELGIAALSNNFGPGTTAALEKRGGVKLVDPNENITKLAQCAFYCKGYAAGGITGSMPEYTVRNFFTDLGIVSTIQGLNMPAKVVRALFTMDAYVLVSGGVSNIRTVQQWLNLTYWQKSWGDLIPCDGHFSRAVQIQLMKAIQSQIGIPDANLNGNFGPATKENLARNEVS